VKILITGATGYIGNLLAHRLADEGQKVHVLVRDRQKAPLLKHANIRIFYGDLSNPKDVENAICGCEQVYHVGGQVKPWIKDSTVFYKANVDGTAIVCEQAIRAGVRKLVFTSTAAVMGPARDHLLDEDASRIEDFSLDYDRSKKIAEDIIITNVLKGLDSVIVSPAKVFGPGHTSHSLTANSIIHSFLKKKIAFIPSPPVNKLCFAYAGDVVNGHILSMEKGAAGQKYILGGHNISYFDFFDRIRSLSGMKGRIIAVPKPLIKLAGYLQHLNHQITGATIRFTARSAEHAFKNYIFSSDKAIKQLGYSITPLDESLLRTIQFLNSMA
jgi:nucleoside-diphosphate-sugar epimerase